MANNSWLTSAGEAKIVNALATTSPFNITKWKIGDTENLSIDQSLTDIVGTLQDNGTVAELEYDVISSDHIIIRVILEEAKGPYTVGNVGLFSDDDTLIAVGALETARPKIPNAIGVVGNRFVISIPIQFVDVQSAINFSVLTGTFASWPFVQVIADLPDPNLAPFEGYIVREDPSQNRPITAIRNEEPPSSGNFVWTLDYHNKIAGDSAADTNTYEIDTSDGTQRAFIGGSQRTILDTSGRMLIGSQAPNHRLVVSDVGSSSSPSNAIGLNLWSGGAVPAGEFMGMAFNTSSDQTLHRSGIFALSESADGRANSLSFLTRANSTGPLTLSSERLRINSLGRLQLFSQGNASDPVIQQSGDTDTGIFFPSLNTLSVTTGGIESLRIDSNHNTRINDGSAATPGLSFINDIDSGLFSAGANELGISTAGIERLRIDTNGIELTTGNQLTLPDNSAGAPSLIFNGSLTTGLYRHSANTIGLSAGGTEVAGIDTQGYGNSILGNASQPSLFWRSDSGTGLYRHSVGTVGITSNGTEVAGIDTQGYGNSISGNASQPSFFWRNDSDSGMYLVTTNEVGITTGGTLRVNFSNAGVRNNVDGTENFPSYSWVDDSNTGMWTPADDTLAWSTNGVERLRLTTSALQLQNSTSFQFPDGSEAAPSIGFVSASDCGWRLDNSNTAQPVLWSSTEGANRLGISEGRIILSGFDYSLRANRIESDFNTDFYIIDGANLTSSTGVHFDLSSSSSTSLKIRGSGESDSVVYSDLDFSSYSALTNSQFSLGHIEAEKRSGTVLSGNQNTRLTFSTYSGGVKTEQLLINSSDLVVNSPLYIADGTAVNPSLAFNSNQDTGIFLDSGSFGISIDGSEMFRSNTTETQISNVLKITGGNSASPALTFATDTDEDTGLYAVEDLLGITINGSNQVILTDALALFFSTVQFSDGIRVSNGSAANPSIGFTNDTSNDTGFFRNGEGVIGTSCNGSLVSTCSSSQITINPTLTCLSQVNAQASLSIGNGTPITDSENITQMYAGNVDLALVNGSTTGNLPPTWSASRIAQGIYRVTHTLNTTDYVVQASTYNIGAFGQDTVLRYRIESTYFEIRIDVEGDGDPSIDEDFMFNLTVLS